MEKMPNRIITLQERGNWKKMLGKKITERRPRVMMARVYMVRLRMRAAVTTSAGRPSIYMK